MPEADQGEGLDIQYVSRAERGTVRWDTNDDSILSCISRDSSKDIKDLRKFIDAWTRLVNWLQTTTPYKV